MATTPRPLYVGASVTEQQATIGLLLVASKHRLTDACISDLTEFLAQLLPKPNVFATNSRELQRKYVQFEDETIKHQCCGHCMALLPVSGTCSSHSCVAANKPNAYFLELPVELQLREHFKGIYMKVTQ